MKNLLTTFIIILAFIMLDSCNGVYYSQTMSTSGYRYSITTGSAKQKKVLYANGSNRMHEVEIKDFSKIKAIGWLNISYTQSDRTEMKIYAPDNILECFIVDVANGKLDIRYKENMTIYYNEAIEIKISSPNLEKVELLGSAKFNLCNSLTTDKFTLESSGTSCFYGTEIICSDNFDTELKGSGEFIFKNVTAPNTTITSKGSGTQKFDNVKTTKNNTSIAGAGNITIKSMNTEKTKVQISGSGDIQMAGKTSEAQYTVNGSGDINAQGMKSQDASCKIAGSGTIKCYSDQSLKIRVRGTGKVKYKGNPMVDEDRNRK